MPDGLVTCWIPHESALRWEVLITYFMSEMSWYHLMRQTGSPHFMDDNWGSQGSAGCQEESLQDGWWGHSELGKICLSIEERAEGYRICLSIQGTQEMWVQALGWEDPLEEEMATDSSNLAWKVPQTEEPGGLQSMRSQRIRRDWATEHSIAHTSTGGSHTRG